MEHKQISTATSGATMISLDWYLYNGYVVSLSRHGQEQFNESYDTQELAECRFLELCREHDIEPAEA